MITKSNRPRFVTADGTEFKTIEEAQVHELNSMIATIPVAETNPSAIKIIAAFLVENAEKVVDVLSMTLRSIPAARAIHGGRKPRKPRAKVNDFVKIEDEDHVTLASLQGVSKSIAGGMDCVEFVRKIRDEWDGPGQTANNRIRIDAAMAKGEK